MSRTVTPVRRIGNAATAGRWVAVHHLDGALAIRIVVVVVTVIATLVPAWNLLQIVAGTGANNPSNDYLAEVGLFDRVLNGTYHWQGWLQDSFIRSHELAIPMLVRLGIILTTHWNIYAELYFGLGCAALKLILVGDALSAAVRRRLRWFIWPGLSALVFAVSQINVFTYGDATLQIETGQCFIALGVWALVRIHRRPLAVGLMVCAGVASCYCGAAGLPAWPAYLLGMVILGYRRTPAYLAWLAGALVSVAPYLQFDLLDHAAKSDQAASILDLNFITATIGLPFSSTLTAASAQQFGTVGCVLAAIGLVLLGLRQRMELWRRSGAPLMLLFYGLANAWIISVFRSSGNASVAPWYAGHAIPFWMGLLGLVAVLWTDARLPTVDRPVVPAPKRRKRANARPHRLTREEVWRQLRPSLPIWLWGAMATLLGASWYHNADLTYADKVFYLNSRAPVSASCLRNAAIAPTYCEAFLFQWGIGHPGYVAALADPLRRHHLSVYAPSEQWTLQGDYVMDSVRVRNTAGRPAIRWSPDLGQTVVPYYDYHHLNLVIPAGSSVSWSIVLPHDLHAANLHTAITSAEGAYSGSSSTVRITLLVAAKQPVRVVTRVLAGDDHGWQPIESALEQYRGQTVTIRIDVYGHSHASGAVVLQYPVINADLASSGGIQPEAAIDWQSVLPTQRDVRLSVKTRRGQERQMNLCLADYSHIAFTGVAAPAGALPVVTLAFTTSTSTGLATPIIQTMALWADGGPHRYTFDLKLLELPVGTRLKSFQLVPPTGSASIHDLRFIRLPGPSTCSSTPA